MICQGYPEEYVLAQYAQANINSPIIPLSEQEPSPPIPGGENKAEDRAGLVNWVFKAIGLPRRQPAREKISATESKKVAGRKKRKSIFEAEEEDFQ